MISQQEYQLWRQRNSQQEDGTNNTPPHSEVVVVNQEQQENNFNNNNNNHETNNSNVGVMMIVDNDDNNSSFSSSYQPTQIQNEEGGTQPVTINNSEVPLIPPPSIHLGSAIPIYDATSPSMMVGQPVPVVTPQQASIISYLAPAMNYEKAPIYSIPETKYTMVLFPGRVKNVSNAIQMLGGMKSIQKLHKKSPPPPSQTIANGKNSKEQEAPNSDSKFLECRFRPGNFMSCHPVYGDATSTNNLLVRIRRKKVKKVIGDKVVTRYDSSNSEISVIGTISKTVNFKGMSDFQYIQPKYVDLDQSMDDDQNGTENAASNNFSNIGDEGDEMHTDDVNSNKSSTALNQDARNSQQRSIYYSDELSEATSTVFLSRASLEHPHTGKNTKHHKAMLDLPPPIFSRFDMPMDYAFKQNPLSEVVPIVSHDGSSNFKRLIKKNKQYVPHCVEINFEDEVPTGPPPDIVNAKDKELYTDMEKKLRKLFGYPDNENEESAIDNLSDSKSRKIRPMWSRSAITSKFEGRKDRWKLRMVLPRIAYHYKSGPWRMLWVRYGYDPKKDVGAAYYQMLDFRIPQELRPKINALAGKKKDDEMETNKFRRLPKRRTDLHIDLHDYLYSGQNKDQPNNENENVAPNATSSVLSTNANTNQGENDDNASYEFNSVPTQIQVFYQLCDIRLSSAQNIIMAEKDEKIPITYGVLLGIKSGEELGLREYVWNQNAECDPKSGWYSHHALEQVRHIMKKKIEEWLEIGEENDNEILSDTEDENEPERQEVTQTENREATQTEATLTDDEMRDEEEDLFIGATTQ
ncbi:RNA polymerase III transcription factor TFIIIC subunit [Naegleria gruberi]|uniref:RNA polymerase III transcription factor TFIIIC subunit n=1 Tax=Naegleria gruberi TaxID=5762 RepID=D2V4V8_NAEGR|nr:RNA polymerase III transcription factor TFIIIC subunit [Naegleria gruberi]EFC48171.1 RNA polymerase III transcription factor TFIIIC subunit [Naegleria gruberi]|eukprot:XP_002680915.1 RNA polymerase III transcription factor TFIIIC subunit [Naegleria gruberi strain NEG-M]